MISDKFQKNYFNYFGDGYFTDVHELVPNVPLTFYSFHTMVGLGFAFVLGFILMPILGIVSPHNEYEADQMGTALGGDGGAIELATALKKLVTENKSFPLSHSIYLYFYIST